MTTSESTQLLLKHSVNHLSCENIVKTPISAILTICDDVRIFHFRYMLLSSSKHSGRRDPSNYLIMLIPTVFSMFTVTLQSGKIPHVLWICPSEAYIHCL